MVKKQIAALRKQLDETKAGPSVLTLGPKEPMPVTFREPRRPSRAHDNQIPDDEGVPDFGPHSRDTIRSRAKAAVANGRSFIA